MQHAVPHRTTALRWTALAILLWGTLCAVLAGFVVYHKQALFASDIDVNGFGLLSRNLALGDGFSLGYGETIRRAPLYPMLGAVVLKLFGNYAPGTPDAITYQPIILVQCLIFGLTALTTWATARKLFGPRVALLAGILCPLVPQSLRYIGQTEVETLMGLFIALLAFTGLRLFERPNLATGAAFGLTAAAATLTKPITQFYPLLFLALAWWFWRTRPVGLTPAIRARVLASVAVLALFALPITPWIAHNWLITDGKFVGISSNAPGETLRGFVAAQPKYFLLRQDFGDWDPEANDVEESILNQQGAIFYHWNSPSAGTMTVVPPIPAGASTAALDAQKDQIESTALKAQLAQHPLDLVRKFAIQLPTFWYLVVDRKQSLIVGAIALVVLALSIIGARRARGPQVAIWPLLALIVYHNVVYAGTLAMARYSMPLYPTLMVLAAAGVMSLAPALLRLARPRLARAAVLKTHATSTG